jgi:peptidoglycan-associated lipoprotein
MGTGIANRAAAQEKPGAASRAIAERASRELEDIHFDFGKSAIRDDMRPVLARNARALIGMLNDYPNMIVEAEGHSEDREEADLELADRRATIVKELLVQMGFPDDRLDTRAIGRGRPQCTTADEECRKRRRRVHFVAHDQ